MSLITIHTRCRLMGGRKRKTINFCICAAAQEWAHSSTAALPEPCPPLHPLLQTPVRGRAPRDGLLCLSANTLTTYTYVSTLQILYSSSKSIFHTAWGRSQCTDNNASNVSALLSAVPARARCRTRSGVSYSRSCLLLQALGWSRELKGTSGQRVQHVHTPCTWHVFYKNSRVKWGGKSSLSP